jgi:sulfur-oxidizing protein SoxZ
MARTLISLPRTARRGEVIEVRVLIQHVMETGFRLGVNGEVVARDIITRFACAWNDETVFAAELFPAITANPFLSFNLMATESGTIRFTWSGDHGFTQSETREIEVA